MTPTQEKAELRKEKGRGLEIFDEPWIPDEHGVKEARQGPDH